MIFERQIVKIQILRTKFKKNSNSDKMSKLWQNIKNSYFDQNAENTIFWLHKRVNVII